MDSSPRRALAMRVVAAALLAHLLYTQPALLFALAHVFSILAVLAVSVRWSHPQWRTHAMIAALCLAGVAFVFAQQAEARYAGSRHD